MRRVRVKICGITRLEDLYASVEAGADALGFIVGVPYSPRNIPLEKAKKLVRETPIFIERVAVTVFKGAKNLIEIYKELKPDIIQVHGEPLPIEQMQEISSMIPIVRAINIASEKSLEEALREATLFDAILVDSHVPGKYGGTGTPHNWILSRRIREMIKPKPLILAGGLKPENVKEAILTVKPFAVDVSTGVESQPGIKDREKLFSFIEEVRRTELCLN